MSKRRIMPWVDNLALAKVREDGQRYWQECNGMTGRWQIKTEEELGQ